jgi:energy-converting hydrogenase Eha subunit H
LDDGQVDYMVLMLILSTTAIIVLFVLLILEARKLSKTKVNVKISTKQKKANLEQVKIAIENAWNKIVVKNKFEKYS